jgi:hypothetical protein
MEPNPYQTPQAATPRSNGPKLRDATVRQLIEGAVVTMFIVTVVLGLVTYALQFVPH